MKPRESIAHLVREISVLAKCDPRTVQKYLRGGYVYGLRVAAIEEAVTNSPTLPEALLRHGIEVPREPE